ncbi:thymopoietin a isoform X2 [Esox lucius]|uniref:thymopoietin a isoform X2 n=1 Tax=Esox lucius TaxID=8010 RepID=UPI001476DD03|nr:thymopoietin a isoform X2 [Esox lucius]
MPEYLEDPSVLTKEKLKNELLANNVALPTGDQRKDVYVQLYLKNLTVQNKKVQTSDTFSSDEELPAPVVFIKSHSGRKATRKTDKPRPEDLDVTGLTNEGLKDELLKYGVNAGPIVASTRKLYERKLQKLLDMGPPEAVAPPVVITKVDSNHNGNSDSDRYSDKEDEVTTVPEPEPVPVPVVETRVRSRGKMPVPITTRTRSSQHNKIFDHLEEEEDDDDDDDDDLEEDWPVLNIKRQSRRATHRVDQMVPASDDTDVSELSGAEVVLPPREAKTKAPLPLGVLIDSRPVSKPSWLVQDLAQSVMPLPEEEVLPARAQSTSPRLTVVPLICEYGGHEPVSLLNTALIEEPAQSDRASVGQSVISQRKVTAEVHPVLAAKPTSLPCLSGNVPVASFPVSPVGYHVSHIIASPAPLHVRKEQLASLSSLSAQFDSLTSRFTKVPITLSEQDQREPEVVSQNRERRQKIIPVLSSVTPVRVQGSVSNVSTEPWVEKIAAGEQTPIRLDEKDILKQMFPYESNTPTGINATCRRPIRGAAGRPIKSSDLWTDETLLRSTSNSYTESRSSTVHRVTTLPPSSRPVTSAASPAGKAVAPRRGLPVWLQLLMLSAVAGFIFFVYQTMEANPMNPFGGADSTQASDSEVSK